MQLSELTTEQILLLEPGVEIRRLICEAMGWIQDSEVRPQIYVNEDHQGRSISEEYSWGFISFYPDKDLDECAEVAEYWQKRSGSVISVKWGLVETEVKVAAPDWTAWYVATAQTLPLAVCRAVLLAAKECK